MTTSSSVNDKIDCKQTASCNEALNDITNIKDCKSVLSKNSNTEVSKKTGGSSFSTGIENNVFRRHGKLKSRVPLHKSIFKKPIDGQQKKQLELKLRTKFASPTDSILSPCSQKLNDYQSVLCKIRSNPTKLAFTKKSDDEDPEEQMSFKVLKVDRDGDIDIEHSDSDLSV
ncbi:hypothetical protein Kpol_1050p60 [Vanderwaltozyma polyspora DSM 70294]|uniref:Uncharacterized protein n=1 Tax=Vanderwaltozyma polyspora (strain ATCC 22028 / DSM 70294 / BCRC 21397 / CBS 2163 / NBRC 10782 / NRRL Y-8283 / UCD 57-17) TaxID=436907 RepID=A7TEV6_VANPO|nr:uncharacterized protein Kpol_1050p60 [Vanderwaltozyma polyspora DSM 70294]EDO19202.1 hypothetical protein Kpol_1050p60 [Vanderwaltozyma polyspora DSM 70294]